MVCSVVINSVLIVFILSSRYRIYKYREFCKNKFLFIRPSSDYVEKLEKAESKKQAEKQNQQSERKGLNRPKPSMLTKDQLDVEVSDTRSLRYFIL